MDIIEKLRIALKNNFNIYNYEIKGRLKVRNDINGKW